MNASFEEKSVWIQLGAMVLGLGTYFVIAVGMLAAGQRDMSAFAALFIVSVGAMILLMSVAYALVLFAGKPEGRDERDRLIAWKSEHRSSWIIAAGVLGAVSCMTLGVENVWTANLLLLSLMVSEVAGFVLQIVYYRRGV
ncbi:MAG: hypothetical protein HRU70_11690 [Phycisphaeraceae bacterium]|nr:MAG: hypothetical protein HRU70_11690 [Phycisphaeraceae bacterium]